LALICVGLSITNYYNITIFNVETDLDDFKGNRSNFLQSNDNSTVITTFDEFNNKAYDTNALTVQASPVKIQILSSDPSASEKPGAKKETGELPTPTLQITNDSGIEATTITTNSNDTQNGTIECSKIDVNKDGSITYTGGNNNLKFDSTGQVFSPVIFNLSPYLGGTYLINPGVTKQWFNFTVKRNYTYFIPSSVYTNNIFNNNTNLWFVLPTDSSIQIGDKIDFVFLGAANANNKQGNQKSSRVKWGNENGKVIAGKSILENFYLNNPRWEVANPTNLGSAGILYADKFQGTTQSDNDFSNMTAFLNFSPLYGNDDNKRNAPGGAVAMFRAVSTSKTGVKWAATWECNQPYMNAYFENNFSPNKRDSAGNDVNNGVSYTIPPDS